MKELKTRIATVVDATTSGAGSEVSSRGSQASAQARFVLNVTSLTAGVSPTLDVDIVHVVDSVNVVLGSFSQITEGGGSDTIVVEACPDFVKVVYTAGGTVADADFTVDCYRF